MKFWWLDDSPRLADEKAKVEALTTSERWFRLSQWTTHQFNFCAEGTIHAHGFDYPIRLVYPDQFPSVPAWVEPQDPDAKWSNHQYGKGGPLCLELRPDNWLPNASGADVLRSAYNLLQKENPLGEGGKERVTSAHNVGRLQSYDWGKEPVLIGAECHARILAGTATDVTALRWSADDNVWPIMLFDSIDKARPEHPIEFDLGTFRIPLAVRIGSAKPTNFDGSTRAELLSAIQVDETGLGENAALLLAVGDETIVPFHSPTPDSVHERGLIVIPDEVGARSGRKAEIATKSVAIVGVGSVGSKIAESLVRAGVRNVLLIDGDVLLPGNLERHALDWRDVGFRKAPAMARHLKHIVAGVATSEISQNLNWQKSAKTQANHVEKLAACDLIVDATGDLPTSLLLGAIAHENRRAFVSAAVFEGGIGCVLARSIPGRDPAFVDGRAAYVAYCESRDVVPPLTGNRTYEAIAENGEPFVADDAAVSMAAAHAARIILDILDDAVGEDDCTWLLIGFKKAWIFTRHGDSVGLVMDPPSSDPPGEDTDAMQFAVKLAKEMLHAATPTE